MNNPYVSRSSFERAFAKRCSPFHHRYEKEIKEFVDTTFRRFFEKVTDENAERMKDFIADLKLRQMMRYGGIKGDAHYEALWAACQSRSPAVRRHARSILESIANRAVLKRTLRIGPEVAPELLSKSDQNEIAQAQAIDTLPLPKFLDEEVLLLRQIAHNLGLSYSEHYKLAGLSFRKGAKLRKNLEALGVVEFTSQRKSGSGRPREIPFVTAKGAQFLQDFSGNEQKGTRP